MALSREAFFEQVSFLIKYVRTKAPLPAWTRVRSLPDAEQAGQLNEVQQLTQLAALDQTLKGVDPASEKGRTRIAETMEQIARDYHWLN